MIFRVVRFAWLASFALLAAACAGSTDDGASDASLALGFELAEGSQVDEVSYSITGNGIDEIEGVIDTSAPGSTGSVELFGIPPGSQYLVTLVATTNDGETRCEGSARFDVVEGVASVVHVMLGCKRAPRFGSVRATGEINVCADLTKVVATPLQTSISNGVFFRAEALDREGDPVRYRWAATGGSLSDPSAAVTTFTCEVDGQQTVALEVSDDDFTECVDGWAIEVTCVTVGGGTDPAPPLVDSTPPPSAATVRSAWLDLSFTRALSAGALEGFSLSCDAVEREFTVHAVGAQGRVVINPRGDLPTDARCELGWTGPEGPTALEFFTYPDAGTADVIYDRTDRSLLPPFPDDAFLVPDPSLPTGKRLLLPLLDRPRDVTNIVSKFRAAIGVSDGFSPIGSIIVELSEAPNQASLPFTPNDSLDPLATVGLIDVDPGSPSYGARIPFELYVRSVAPTSDPANPEHVLVMFPSIPLASTGQYALVISKRALAAADRPFAPSSFTSAVLGAPEAGEDPAVTNVRDILVPALAGIADASPPFFADDVALVTRITIRSTAPFTLTPLSMREQIEQLPPSTFEIDLVRSGSFNVEAVVTGTWEAPEFRVDGRTIARDSNGLPILQGTRQVPFILAIPRTARETPAPVTMYQHGNPGSAESEVPFQADRYLAENGHAVIGFTDISNREIGQDTGSQQQAILVPLFLEGVLPEFDTQTLGEQLAFLRFIQELDELDVVPFGAPDGLPDLDVSLPVTYDGISEGANKGQAFVPYAPEIVAAALTVGGARRAEILFYQDEVSPDGVSTELLDSVQLFGPNVRPAEFYVGTSLYQLAADRQDPQNHVSFMYANPIEVGGTFKKPSVLVQEGLRDTLIPNNATRSLVYALGATPLIQPVAEPVLYLMQAEAPLTANVDAQTTSGYAQYVPNGLPDLPVTPGCEVWTEGHFCPQTARVALDQRFRFFETALQDEAPTIDVGQEATAP